MQYNLSVESDAARSTALHRPVDPWLWLVHGQDLSPVVAASPQRN